MSNSRSNASLLSVLAAAALATGCANVGGDSLAVACAVEALEVESDTEIPPEPGGSAPLIACETVTGECSTECEPMDIPIECPETEAIPDVIVVADPLLVAVTIEGPNIATYGCEDDDDTDDDGCGDATPAHQLAADEDFVAALRGGEVAVFDVRGVASAGDLVRSDTEGERVFPLLYPGATFYKADDEFQFTDQFGVVQTTAPDIQEDCQEDCTGSGETCECVERCTTC